VARVSLLIAVMLSACLVLANIASVRAKLAEATPPPPARLTEGSPLTEMAAASPTATATPRYPECGGVVPGTFIGTVTIDGEPAPDGTTIQAVMNGIVWGTTEVEEGGYGVMVPQMWAEWFPCGEFEPDSVEFYVDGLKADESPEWHDGLNKVNLTFFTQGSGIPAPPAWRTPSVTELPPLAITPTPGTVPTLTPGTVPTPTPGTASAFAAISSPDVAAMPAAVPAGGVGAELAGGETWWPLGLLAAGGLVGVAALLALSAGAWYAKRRL
jgi:hypothetical protein